MSDFNKNYASINSKNIEKQRKRQSSQCFARTYMNEFNKIKPRDLKYSFGLENLNITDHHRYGSSGRSNRSK